MNGIFLDVDFKDFLNRGIDYLVVNYSSFFRGITNYLLHYMLVPLETFLLWLNPLVIIAVVGLLAWFAFGRIINTVLFMVIMYAIGSIGLWEQTMQSLSILIVSIILVVIVGLPTGIILSRFDRVTKMIMPILDAMQTFPIFVYMLPVVMLFSIGKLPAVIATFIYALPPIIRFTIVGIKQVSSDISEVVDSFGASSWQKLRWVLVPLAIPIIMAGLNQSTLMALSMVVVASMIGARGPGEDVLYGITNLDFGRGFNAGLAIVMLAFVIDRIIQAYGKSKRMRLSDKKNTTTMDDL